MYMFDCFAHNRIDSMTWRRARAQKNFSVCLGQYKRGYKLQAISRAIHKQASQLCLRFGRQNGNLFQI